MVLNNGGCWNNLRNYKEEKGILNLCWLGWEGRDNHFGNCCRLFGELWFGLGGRKIRFIHRNLCLGGFIAPTQGCQLCWDIEEYSLPTVGWSISCPQTIYEEYIKISDILYLYICKFLLWIIIWNDIWIQVICLLLVCVWLTSMIIFV